jgi:hypothetical protein
VIFITQTFKHLAAPLPARYRRGSIRDEGGVAPSESEGGGGHERHHGGTADLFVVHAVDGTPFVDVRAELTNNRPDRADKAVVFSPIAQPTSRAS